MPLLPAAALLLAAPPDRGSLSGAPPASLLLGEGLVPRLPGEASWGDLRRSLLLSAAGREGEGIGVLALRRLCRASWSCLLGGWSPACCCCCALSGTPCCCWGRGCALRCCPAKDVLVAATEEVCG
jgi:hypothetical protein